MIIDHLIKPAYSAPLNLGSLGGSGKFMSPVPAGPGASSIIKDRLSLYLSTIVTTITVVAGLAFIIYFSMAAFKWITSSGDKSQVSEAQTQMTQAAIGLIALVASYFIIGIIGGVLGINILNPGTMLGL